MACSSQNQNLVRMFWVSRHFAADFCGNISSQDPVIAFCIPQCSRNVCIATYYTQWIPCGRDNIVYLNVVRSGISCWPANTVNIRVIDDFSHLSTKESKTKLSNSVTLLAFGM